MPTVTDDVAIAIALGISLVATVAGVVLWITTTRADDRHRGGLKCLAPLFLLALTTYACCAAPLTT